MITELKRARALRTGMIGLIRQTFCPHVWPSASMFWAPEVDVEWNLLTPSTGVPDFFIRLGWHF